VTDVRNTTNVVKYTRLSRVYDRVFGNRWILHARRRAFDLLPALPAGSRLLLDGIGTGADVLLVPERVHALGVDLVDPMLRQAQHAHPSLSLALMDAERLGFADETFEAVALSLLLSVVEHGAIAMAEAVRVTRRGGYVLVFDKFAPTGAGASRSRRLLNIATSALGTDITRELNDLVRGQPIEVVSEDRSLLGGYYQATLFRRLAAAI
jgi:phosphatidylethanolamine/phosphatidyl-N-methylethanolamine N-methyltransferase